MVARATATGDDTRIPMSVVVEIGSDVALAADAEDLATSNTERWARENVIAHIPGNGMTNESDD